MVFIWSSGRGPRRRRPRRGYGLRRALRRPLPRPVRAAAPLRVPGSRRQLPAEPALPQHRLLPRQRGRLRHGFDAAGADDAAGGPAQRHGAARHPPRRPADRRRPRLPTADQPDAPTLLSVLAELHRLRGRGARTARRPAGSWLTVRRLLRCRPGAAGGADPVPARPLGRTPDGPAGAPG
nr:membrane protein insertion efficiency factor YidD [Blastococcus colisei]